MYSIILTQGNGQHDYDIVILKQKTFLFSPVEISKMQITKVLRHDVIKVQIRLLIDEVFSYPFSIQTLTLQYGHQRGSLFSKII